MSTFFVGPLKVEVEASEPALERRIDDQLRIFERRWLESAFDVRIVVNTSPGRAGAGTGSYLQCSRMTVDASADGLRATTLCGATARVERSMPGGATWAIDFPQEEADALRLDEIEDLVGLALVSGWRACGWTPVHAGAVTGDDRCAILCATSGGGKSTLTAALVRAGWRTLGDDKLLLRANADGTLEVAALLQTFNLHPRTSEWFPEVGDLERLPFYSAWTVKRKVRTEDIWPGGTADRARPTHVVRVRRDDGAGMRVTPLSEDEVFRTLIGQIAIPKDRAIAQAAMKTAAAAVRSGLRGLELSIGDGAYRDPSCVDALAEAMA